MKCGKRRCPREALPGYQRCERCTTQSREQKTSARALKLATGTCFDCTAPAADGKRRCPACLELAADSAAERHKGKRRRPYRAQQNGGADEFDIACPPRLSDYDRKLLAAGRCKCGLLLPCYSCGPTILELASARRDAA